MIAALLITLTARAAQCQPDPAALLRGVAEAWPGEARTLVSEPQTLLVGEQLALGERAGRRYVLAASGEPTALLQHGLVGEEFVDEYDPTYQLVLLAFDARDPGGRPLDAQVLFSQESPAVLPVLRWAGDLDGDRRPDLLLDLSREETTLLLSDAAEGGMVQAVAVPRAAGC